MATPSALDHDQALSAPPRGLPWSLAEVAFLLAMMLLALALGWTGYMASDDANYHVGAVRWFTDPPFPGDNHWSTRFPVVLTLAAAIAMFGPGELALAATALLWYFAFVAVSAMLANRIGGPRIAILAVLLIGTMPLVATFGSITNCDLPEVTFLVLGLWLLCSGRSSSLPGPAASLLAGICFGIAMLCRETAVLALFGLVPIFLLGRPLPRKTLLIAAAGGALVLGGEALFQWIVTGDPLHRYFLAFNHDDTMSRAAAREGNLLIHPLLDPLLVLLINNEFALLFWLGAFAVAARFHRQLTAGQARMLILPLALGLTSFLLVGLLSTKLVLNPRYFTTAAIPAAIAAAFWLVQLSTFARWSILAASLSTNFLMLSAQNAHPQWPAEALVEAAAAYPGQTIRADQNIFDRAELVLRWRGLQNASAKQGSLLIIEEERVPPGSPVLERYPAPATPLGRLLKIIGVDPVLPEEVRQRLLAPGPTMILVSTSP